MVTIPASFNGINSDEALVMVDSLCKLSYEFGMQNNLEDLHKVLKQILGLYIDCKNARLALSERLLELEFVPFAVKTMKMLNNLAVFTTDDIWFSTFYLYNICWNYSNGNPNFVSALVAAKLRGLLISNINHTPYTEYMTNSNVAYLIKATLSIMHNILRVPKYRRLFTDNKIITALLNLSKREDLTSVLSTICLGFIACNEIVASTEQFDIKLNTELIIFYITSAISQGNKYLGLTMFELLEVLRASSICKLQLHTIQTLGLFDTLIELLTTTRNEREQTELLLILANIVNKENKAKIRETVELYLFNRSVMITNVAKSVLWKISLCENVNESSTNSDAIFVCFANDDELKATTIAEKLSDECKIVPLQLHENDCDLLIQCYDQANIVIVCVSESFKNAINFLLGSEYCLRQKKVIFPVLMDDNYRGDGWLKDFIRESSDVCYQWSKMDSVEKEWYSFKDAVMTQVAISEMYTKQDICMEDNDKKMVTDWLNRHNIGHLLSKVDKLTMSMLLTLKKIRQDAPDYYFNALEKHLQLSFVELLQFNVAIDSLS